MNSLIVLSALVSAAFAVPYSARLSDSYGSYDSYGGDERVVLKSYDEPRYISRPVITKSYDVPVISKSYNIRSSYDRPELSYERPVYGRAYASEPVYASKGYGRAVSSQYSVKISHDAPSKSYGDNYGYSKSYEPVSYGRQIVAKSYAPIVERSYSAPVVTKYVEPVLKSYGLESNYGRHY